jgi:hypothetical protein
MSSASHGASAGVVLGIVAALLGQQFGWLNLSDLLPTVEYLGIGIVVGGIVGGGIGLALGRRYLPKRPAPVAPWAPGSSTPATSSDAAPSSGATPPTSGPSQ